MAGKPWSEEVRAAKGLPPLSVREAKKKKTAQAPDITRQSPDPVDLPPPPPNSGGTMPPLETVPNNDAESEATSKKGLAEAFRALVKGGGRLIQAVGERRGLDIEIEEVSVEEGAIWADLAMPVYKKLLPKMEKDPAVPLIVFTGLLVGGKIKIKKREQGGI